MRRAIILAMALLATPPVMAQDTTQPKSAPATFVHPDKAYLFAHMTKERYGILYYSVSRDGLYWRRINGGKPVSEDYRATPRSRRAPTAATISSATSTTTIR